VGDVGRLDQAGGQLVQQRLEQVVVVLLSSVTRTGGLVLASALTAASPANPAPTTTTCGDPLRCLSFVIDPPSLGLIVQAEYARYRRSQNSSGEVVMSGTADEGFGAHPFAEIARATVAAQERSLELAQAWSARSGSWWPTRPREAGPPWRR
jgi:hypothetical protein